MDPSKSCCKGSERAEIVAISAHEILDKRPNSECALLRTCTSHTVKQSPHYDKGFTASRKKTYSDRISFPSHMWEIKVRQY